MNIWLRAAVGILSGGSVGWAVYRFVGCESGACPITSNPYVSIVDFAVAGLMVALS